jgi:hypothetical protein
VRLKPIHFIGKKDLRVVKTRLAPALAPVILAALVAPASANPIHSTYLWHLHQPIYWNAPKSGSPDRNERAWDTIQAQRGGRLNPSDNVETIFSVADRVAAYQYRPRTSVNMIRWHPEAGTQVNMSGALIENVQSLSGNLSGYYFGWEGSFQEARGWTATYGKPRMDIVQFTYHHSLAPLHSQKTFEMELKLHRRKMEQVWGMNPPISRGYFPTEMAFSQRLIPTLKSMGVDWAIVSGNHISRACMDFPLVLGTGGENTEPPNRSDQLNPPQTNYFRMQISRGCSPCNAMPLAYTPQRARYVDPDSGQIHEIIVVPAAQEFGWLDGYNPLSVTELNPLKPFNNPSRPMLVLLAHDGDNAWGGGYSYYEEAVPNFVGAAEGNQIRPSTVEQYLAKYPVPASAVVHVEDGAWVNADSDFGSPTFVNWLYPLLDASGQPDPANGWHEKAREYAMFTAAENRVRTAEQVAGVAPRLDHILDPNAGSTNVERAWHYYLGSLDSGNVYYGTPGDMEIRSTVGCNAAFARADSVLTGSFVDTTTPTIFIPQRWPYNPGDVNFGVTTGYQQRVYGPDFTVWTFIYDVSGIAGATLKWRVDADGVNSTQTVHNETYAGGADVGPWQTIAMTGRPYPKHNVYNKPEINYTVLPTYVADHYHAVIAGQAGKLIDYYVEAVDNQGNISRSPIKHVYVGTQTGGGGGGGGSVVTIVPATPTAGQQVMVQYNPAGRNLASAPTVRLHWGVNNWAVVASPDPVMTWNAGNSRWETTVTLPINATQLDVVFNDGAGTWDNNAGADWHFPVQGAPPPPFTVDGNEESSTILRSSNPNANGLKLWIANQGTVLYVGTQRAANSNDHFILLTRSLASTRSAPWAKAGTVVSWDAFLANEVGNNWAGWFDAAGGQTLGAFTQVAAGGPGGVLEGTVDLAQLYGGAGNVPSTVYVCAAAYGTNDGASLVHSIQVPVSINADGNIDGGEFFAFDVVVAAGVSGWELY